MTKEELIEALKEYPDNARVEIGKFLALPNSRRLYEVRLDYPIIGIAHHKESNELLFVVGCPGESQVWLSKFGKATRFKGKI